MTTAWPWVQLFVRQFELCDARPDENVVVLTDPVALPAMADTADLALHNIGCRVTRVVLPLVGRNDDTLDTNPVARAALAAADLVIDCTRHGIQSSKALTELLEAQTRILVIDAAHPRDLEHVVPHPGLQRRVQHATELLRGVELSVTTSAGTRLRLGLRGAEITGASGVAERPGTLEHWPAGSVRIVPRDDTVSGTLVLMPGDIVLSAGSRVRSPVTLVFEHDHISDIQGDSGDADLIRSQLEMWDSTAAYGIASLAWGMALSSHDPGAATTFPTSAADATDTQLAAGVVTVHTGANSLAGRDAPGGIALCVRQCTVAVDGIEIIRDGQLEGGLAPDVYELAARG